jgi:hypothetical protein
MNAETGQVITTLPIGDHVDATAFDPESKLTFNSNGEGTVTAIHQDGRDRYSVVETVKTLPRAKTMALEYFDIDGRSDGEGKAAWTQSVSVKISILAAVSSSAAAPH